MGAQPAGPIYGAIEAGGTKFVCALARADGTLLEECRLPTRDPESTLEAACQFLRSGFERHGTPAAIGVASFGPVCLDRSSALYGHITRTPKPGWSNTDMAAVFGREFGCPVGFDTDVNAAALAEQRWGAGRGLSDLVYVTVGTGIGGGVIVAGEPLHGLMHPEIGHLYVRRHTQDEFEGVCPFHGDCLEGLASGPAIVARCGLELGELPVDHPQWSMEAHYLAQLCSSLVLTLSPQRIILGGGVVGDGRLLPSIRTALAAALGGYIDRPAITAQIDSYVVTAALGGRAGVMGALLLAINALRSPPAA